MGNQSQRVIHLAFWMYKLHQITQHKKSLKHLRNSFGLQDLKSSDTCYGVTWTPFAAESHSTPCAHCLDRKITQRIQNSANLPSCVVILDVWSWNILNMSAMASIDIRAISCVENVGSTRLCQSCLVGTGGFKLSDWAAAWPWLHTKTSKNHLGTHLMFFPIQVQETGCTGYVSWNVTSVNLHVTQPPWNLGTN